MTGPTAMTSDVITLAPIVADGTVLAPPTRGWWALPGGRHCFGHKGQAARQLRLRRRRNLLAQASRRRNWRHA